MSKTLRAISWNFSKAIDAMNFQQLRSIREAARHQFNLTEVAALLFISQPSISRQIRELEEELGVEIFTRVGKRLTGLTSPGQTLLPLIERLLLEADNLKNAGRDFTEKDSGTLFVAATHSQARYALPAVVRDFRQMYPGVTLHLRQGSPQQIADMLLGGEADIGVATEALANYERLLSLPGYRWSHSVIVPPGHPLLRREAPISLEDLTHYPIITYEHGFTCRRHQNLCRAGHGHWHRCLHRVRSRARPAAQRHRCPPPV